MNNFPLYDVVTIVSNCPPVPGIPLLPLKVGDEVRTEIDFTHPGEPLGYNENQDFWVPCTTFLEKVSFTYVYPSTHLWIILCLTRKKWAYYQSLAGSIE